jgi:hypothetical protein
MYPRVLTKDGPPRATAGRTPMAEPSAKIAPRRNSLFGLSKRGSSRTSDSQTGGQAFLIRRRQSAGVTVMSTSQAMARVAAPSRPNSA